jgi:arylsulfatase A-like enzyme
MVGKWHLGFKPEYLPTKRGFDEFYGFLGGAHSYMPATGRAGDAGNPVMRGTQAIDAPEYLTDAFSKEATAFIERNRNRPYFLYMPFNAVHAPMEVVERYKARFPNISDDLRRTHAAMLTAMDDAIGAILAAVRANRQESNTLVVFISDNGGPTPQNTSSNKPLRGFKAQVYEGGIRVPFLMRWPGRIKPGTVYRQPVIALDIHSTLVAAGGGTIPPGLDGVDLLPFVAGRQGAPHQALYWRFGEQSAIRMGDWKMLRFQGRAEMYNLRDDIGESKDLAGSNPEKLRELESAWNAWNAQMVAPKWGRADRGGGAGKKKGKKKKA